jgi:uncharacterized OB-fold protein
MDGVASCRSLPRWCWPVTDEEYGDPLSRPFWAAARERRLILQRCVVCGHRQFYPRPFCLKCMGGVEWVESPGRGTVYSKTDVTVEVPGFTPPYCVAIIELDEGPRLMSHIVGDATPIGGRVRIEWRERPDGLPPLYVFVAAHG